MINTNEITDDLYNNFSQLKNLMFKFLFNFGRLNSRTLNESKLSDKLAKESKDLLLDIKNCTTRIQKDIQSLNYIIQHELQYKNKASWYNDYSNLRDCLNTCENTINTYNTFLRKDIKILKESFKNLIDALIDYQKVVKIYNQNRKEYFLPEVTKKHELLYQTVSIGFSVVDLKDISFQKFREEYPEADESFNQYLKTNGFTFSFCLVSYISFNIASSISSSIILVFFTSSNCCTSFFACCFIFSISVFLSISSFSFVILIIAVKLSSSFTVSFSNIKFRLSLIFLYLLSRLENIIFIFNPS